MRPRINPNHVGSSKECREVIINRIAYKNSKYENVESSIRIVDVLDKKTLEKFKGMEGTVWQHTYAGHTIQITPIEASMLLRNGIKGVSVTVKS